MSHKIVDWAAAQQVGSAPRKSVFMNLARHSDAEGIAFPAPNTQAKATELCQSSVYKHLKALIQQGRIKQVRIARTNITGQEYQVDGWQLLGIPPDEKTRSQGGSGVARDGTGVPRRGKPLIEPSKEPPLRPVAFVAPALSAGVEQLREAMGKEFASLFQEARFEEYGPTILVRSEFFRRRLEESHTSKLHDVFGPEFQIAVIDRKQGKASDHARL